MFSILSTLVINPPSDPLRQGSSGVSSASLVQPMLSFARIPLLRAVTALLILTLVTLVRFLPSLTDYTQQYLGGVEGDNGLYVWLFRHHIHNLIGGAWFETNAFYPYQGTLAWSDSFILPGILGYLLVSAGLTEAAAYNVIILSAYTLSGFWFWLCIARITGSTAAGLISAIGWMSWSYWGLHVGHPQLLFHLFLPAGLYLFFCAIRTPSIVNGMLAAALIIAAFATTAYYAIFLVLMWGALVIGLAIAKPATIFKLAHLRSIIGALLIAPGLVPFVLPYFSTLELFGERGLYEAHYFSPSVLAWLAAPQLSLLFYPLSRWGVGEAYLFPGIIITALAALSCLRLARARALQQRLALIALSLLVVFSLSIVVQSVATPYPWRIALALSCWFFLGTVVVCGLKLRSLESKRGFSVLTHRALIFSVVFLCACFFVLALGPLGNPEKEQLTLGPWAALHYITPGASAIRAVSRLGIVVMLGLCALAGLGIGLSLPAFPRILVVTPFLILIIWVEGSMKIQPAQALAAMPSALRSLNTQEPTRSPTATDSPVVIIGLPYAGHLTDAGAPESWTDFATRQTRLLNWLTPGSIKAINGYSGQQTKIMRELPRALRGFPDQRSLDALCSFPELRYVFVSDGLALPNKLPTALVSVDSSDDKNYLFRLSCAAVAFEKREFVLPARANSVTCSAENPAALTIGESSPQRWGIEYDKSTITLKRNLENKKVSGHLSWVTVNSQKKTSVSDCKVTYADSSAQE